MRGKEGDKYKETGEVGVEKKRKREKKLRKEKRAKRLETTVTERR